MVEEKYIGMALAMASSLLIGTSFVLTKKGLMETTSRYGSATEGLQYFKNVLWWAGMTTSKLTLKKIVCFISTSCYTCNTNT